MCGIVGVVGTADAASILLVFLLGRRLGKAVGSDAGGRADLVGVLAAAFFAVLTIGKATQGLFANAEHFVLLPALAALLCLSRGIEMQRIIHDDC